MDVAIHKYNKPFPNYQIKMEEQYIFDFCERIAETTSHITDTKHLILHLIRTGVIDPKTALNFMSIVEYDKQLKRTKSGIKRKGCKDMAISFTSAKLPICERKIWQNVKNRNIRFNNSLFVRK